MQAGGTDAADVHAWPFPNRLQAFEYGDVFGGVVRGCHVYNVRLVRDAASVERLLLCVCSLIVAAFQAPLARAAAIVEDAPVPGSTAAFARALGVDPTPDRARYMHEMTRLVYDTTEFRVPAVAAFLQALRQPPKNAGPILGGPNAADSVPVPLPADLWADAVFHRRVNRDTLVTAILADRHASLLCHGLTKLDDETLEFFAQHPSLLTRIYERSAPLFASFGASIRVRNNRVVPVGDEMAVPLWEMVANEKTTRPDRFVTALLEANDGRLGYLYDLVDQMDPPRRAFMLGAWLNEAARLERFKTLATSGLGAIREWHVRVLPFGRSSYDLGLAILRIEVDEQGRPRPPAARGFWTRVFSGSDVPDNQPFDAAWVAENVVAADVRQRAERLDQVTFAQRVFKGDADGADQVFVLRAMPRFRALMLTLERAGVKAPSIYAALAKHAAKAASFEGRRGYVVQSQLQGSIALVSRMAMAGTLAGPARDRLLERLAALNIDGTTGYAGAVARWLREQVHPAMPHANDIEGALIAGLSGPPADPATVRRITWEGQRYRLDLTASEQQRLRRVREKQGGPAIDLPLQMAEAAQLLRSEKLTADDLQDVVTQFTALATDLPEKAREEEADDLPVGVGMPPPLHETIRKANEDLTRALRNKDLKRAPRIAEPIVELADDLLARTMLSLVYAISLGDPEGTVLLADDVSHRHDFGYAIKDGEMRARLVWAIPRQEVAPNVPWHVSGSLLGLDIALSTLALRRVATDHMLEAPKLTSNARDTFAASVSLLDPSLLRDADRDAIADNLERGRTRLANLNAEQLAAVARELQLDAARIRALKWLQAHGTSDFSSMFSSTESLILGGGRLAELQPWGMAVVAVNGCLCTRLTPPGNWRALSGRPQLGLAATILPDVNFRVAQVLKELGLPAAVAKVILSAAMQDFIDEVRPTDDGDWLALSRAAHEITRERIEDYVAAATASGPLMPDVPRTPER